MSVALQMVANGGDTEGLFRGAFMESGALLPNGDVSFGQRDYDNLVRAAGCTGAEDTLECLRQVPFPVLNEVINMSPSSTIPIWVPRADGTFLKALPQRLVLQGSVAKIPFVNGACDDEGTLFALSRLNVTTDAQFEEYIRGHYFSTVGRDEVQEVLSLYPSDLAQGSPYDTGALNALTPQFKRIASIQGDIIFQGPKRFFLEHLAPEQNAWSFVSNTTKSLPIFGSAHVSDLLEIYRGGPLVTSLINFVNHLDPNGESGNRWPRYSLRHPKNFVFGPGTTSIQDDTHRKKAISVLNSVLLRHPM